jgi:hypothetical protein
MVVSAEAPIATKEPAAESSGSKPATEAPEAATESSSEAPAESAAGKPTMKAPATVEPAAMTSTMALSEGARGHRHG